MMYTIYYILLHIRSGNRLTNPYIGGLRFGLCDNTYSTVLGVSLG
jgi:hypothetical protein